VVGGIGGRLAMFVLRLTSSSTLHGVATDDGFTIGIVSVQTGFLLIAATVLGAGGGAIYLVIRGWLPERARPWITAVIGGILGGGAIIRPGGIDFGLLDPLPLAVAMFIAIPALGAAAISVVAERLLADGSSTERANRWLLGLVPLTLVAVLGPFGLIAMVATILIGMLGPRYPALGEAWTSRLATGLGRVALIVATAAGAVVLANDIGAVL
jgi:hypothetical protein